MATDQELRQRVESELEWEPRLHAGHIGVAVDGGVVTLTGHVPSYVEKYSAERAVKRVAGVKGLADELEVQLPGELTKSDDAIAQAAVAALRSDLSVPYDHVRPVVRDGQVTLEGEVEWAFQRSAAERAVRHLAGVRGVINSIRIKPQVAPSEIRQKIEAAFKRNALLDARHISINADGGVVTLRGDVSSWVEREEAENIAWAAPGVTGVNDQLIVTG